MPSQIISDPAVLSGKPCISGTRISVEMILEWVASGASREEIIRAYPHLTADGVGAALQYAAQTFDHETVVTAEIAS